MQWSHAGLDASVHVRFPAGLEAGADFRLRGKALDVRRLALKDRDSDAVLRLAHRGALVDAGFTGVLTGASLASMLAQAPAAISGGVKGARDRYMLDYWGLSFKEASQALLEALSERHDTKPGGRRWKVAVCGPHRSPQVEFGPDFETTWDPQGADFALMLGEFYCVKLDAPLLAEITRDGVVYARVYDIRGRSFPTLLTQPGL